MVQDMLSARRQAAHIYAMGRAAILIIGTLGLIAACLGAIFLVFQFALLVLISITTCCAAIGSTFAEADPLVRVLLLVSIGFVVAKLCRKVWRR